MKIINDYICNQKKLPNLVLDYEYVTIHSTGNLKSSGKNERDNLNRPDNTTYTGFHYVVDEKEIIGCIPENMVAWHSGDGKFGRGNRKSISIEICESGNRDLVVERAAELAADLLRKKNLNVEALRRHFDWSGKICPRIFSDNNWEYWNIFKKKVEKHLQLENIDIDNQLPIGEKQAISYMTENGYMDGNGLDNYIKKGELAIILYKMGLKKLTN